MTTVGPCFDCGILTRWKGLAHDGRGPLCAGTPPYHRPTCQWFALCDKLALTTVTHPILGPVPVCLDCEKRATDS